MTYWYWHVRQLNVLWPSITLDQKTLGHFPRRLQAARNEQSCVEYRARGRPGDRSRLRKRRVRGVCFRRGAGSLAVDISPAAIANTKENCRRFGRESVMSAERHVRQCQRQVNLYPRNPPYIEAEFEDNEAQFATSTRYVPVLFAQARGITREGRPPARPISRLVRRTGQEACRRSRAQGRQGPAHARKSLTCPC